MPIQKNIQGDASGNVGVNTGTSDIEQPLHVNGAIQLGTDFGGNNAGRMQWNNATKTFQIDEGAGFVDLGGLGSLILAHTIRKYPQNKLWMPEFNFELNNNLTDAGLEGYIATLEGTTPPTYDGVEFKVGTHSLLIPSGGAVAAKVGLGVTNLIKMDDSFPGWSFMCWFKTPTPASGASLLIRWDVAEIFPAGSRLIQIDLNGDLIFLTAGGGGADVLHAAVDDDAWHHIAIVADQKDPYLAVNAVVSTLDGGAEVETVVDLGGSLVDQKVELGHSDSTFDYNIDSAVYYNYPISRGHILAHAAISPVNAASVAAL